MNVERARGSSIEPVSLRYTLTLPASLHGRPSVTMRPCYSSLITRSRAARCLWSPKRRAHASLTRPGPAHAELLGVGALSFAAARSDVRILHSGNRAAAASGVQKRRIFNMFANKWKKPFRYDVSDEGVVYMKGDDVIADFTFSSITKIGIRHESHDNRCTVFAPIGDSFLALSRCSFASVFKYRLLFLAPSAFICLSSG